LVPATEVILAVRLEPELGSCLVVAALMRQADGWLQRGDLADAAADLPPNGSEGLAPGEGLELRVFGGQGSKVRHEDSRWEDSLNGRKERYGIRRMRTKVSVSDLFIG